MKYSEILNKGQVVESTEQTQDEIMESIDAIFRLSNRIPEVYISIDDTRSKVFVCLYREPLIHNTSGDIICLRRDGNNTWLPEPNISDETYNRAKIDSQLAKLGRDSQDSQ